MGSKYGYATSFARTRAPNERRLWEHHGNSSIGSKPAATRLTPKTMDIAPVMTAVRCPLATSASSATLPATLAGSGCCFCCSCRLVCCWVSDAPPDSSCDGQQYRHRVSRFGAALGAYGRGRTGWRREQTIRESGLHEFMRLTCSSSAEARQQRPCRGNRPVGIALLLIPKLHTKHSFHLCILLFLLSAVRCSQWHGLSWGARDHALGAAYPRRNRDADTNGATDGSCVKTHGCAAVLRCNRMAVVTWHAMVLSGRARDVRQGPCRKEPIAKQIESRVCNTNGLQNASTF